jgi:hypothetical protein
MNKAYKAELYRGKVKKTKNQKKKHVTQMTKEEVAYLKKEIKMFPTWKAKASKHLKKKCVSLDLNDVQDTLLARNVEDFIVEYNETLNASGQMERRILIRVAKPKMVRFKTRKKKIVEALAHLCFVVSLDTWEIVTAYWNKASDEHAQLDWRRYSKHLRIIK